MSNNFENRPLSPHLSIHKKVLTAVFSIFHRITGIGLSLGAILISIWFILISLGPVYFAYFQMISSTIFFKLILILWSFGIFYHLFNGIRKLYWSFGIGMDLRSVYSSGYAVILLTFLSTIMVWLFA
jgi:succinate dehydrogenase / fumarate reductase cytochrome b subunit